MSIGFAHNGLQVLRWQNMHTTYAESDIPVGIVNLFGFPK